MSHWYLPLMPLPPFGDVPDFEPSARRALDWVARYLENPERFPVLSRVAPGDIRAALPASPPERGESLDAILDDFERVVLPGPTELAFSLHTQALAMYFAARAGEPSTPSAGSSRIGQP